MPSILIIELAKVDTSEDVFLRAELSSGVGTYRATTLTAMLARSQMNSRIIDSMVKELQVKPFICMHVQNGNILIVRCL